MKKKLKIKAYNFKEFEKEMLKEEDNENKITNSQWNKAHKVIYAMRDIMRVIGIDTNAREAIAIAIYYSAFQPFLKFYPVGYKKFDSSFEKRLSADLYRVVEKYIPKQ